jgi:glycosyltransferase involved in cell wall biosynthesis
MTQEPVLTILITTYNRSVVLDAVLSKLSSYQDKGLAFNILVSDDCSTDNTKEICKKWEDNLHGFSYLKTEQNLGMDNNFKNVYENFHTEFCWLLGDTRQISFDGLKSVIDILSTSNHDALILRCREEMSKERIEYSDINTLMSQQGWHITNNASCVIPKRFITPLLYHRYWGTTFLHMGIFVENLCMVENFNVLYMGDVYITELETPGFTKGGWISHPFLNFGKLWYEFVMSLPNQIDIDIKHQVLLDHNKYTKIFDISEIHKRILTYRETYINSYRENRRYMPYVVTTPLWIYDLLICVIPLSIYDAVFDIYKTFFKREDKKQ